MGFTIMCFAIQYVFLNLQLVEFDVDFNFPGLLAVRILCNSIKYQR